MITIEPEGVQQSIRSLNLYINLIQRRTPTMIRLLANLSMKQTKKRLRSEKKDSDGSSWKPWSKSYAKERKGKKGSMLVRDGTMLKSLRVDVRGSQGRMGTPIPYGRHHQKGTKRMPARPWLGVSKENLEQMESSLDRWLKNAMEVNE